MPTTKYSDQLIREIRELNENSPISQKELAEKFGIGREYIRKLVNYETRPHA